MPHPSHAVGLSNERRSLVPHGPAPAGNLNSVPKRRLWVRQATTTLGSEWRTGSKVFVSLRYGHAWTLT